MGAMGRPAKPVELKLLEGNRGHRPIDLSATFRPEVGEPDVPKHLSREARKAWKRLAVELLRYNLLAKVDRDAFGMLCQTVGRCEILERAIAAKMALVAADGKDPAEGLVDTTPQGYRMQSVHYQLLSKEQEKLHKLLESFGMRPDARARVQLAIRAQLQLFDGNAPLDGDMPAPTGFAGFQ